MTTHESSAIRINIAAPDRDSNWRYRGRCSCGWTTHLHYSTPLTARTATDRVHIHHRQNEGANA